MAKRYYENLYGVTKNDVCLPNSRIKDNPSKKGREKSLRERKKYGYDLVETYSVDYTALIWLYEHIKIMIEVGSKIINYDAEHDWDDSERKVFNELGINPKTDNEAFDILCKYIEEGFKYMNSEDDEVWDDDLAHQYFAKVWKLWAAIFTRAWW